MKGVIEVVEVLNKGRNKVASIDGEFYYMVVLDGKELNMIAETPDIAMLLGLERKYCGINSQFTKFACRMLNIESAWAE